MMVFTGIKSLEYRFIWNNKNIKIGGEPLTATRVTSIAFRDTREEPGITIVNHFLKEIAKKTTK